MNAEHINTLSQLLQLTEKYGLSVMLLLAFIYLYHRQNTRIFNILNDQNKELLRNKESLRSRKEFKQTFEKKDPIIKAALNKLLYTLHANRVYIFEYHNGGSNICGIGFKKMRNTYEIVDGVDPKIRSYQEIPCSIFASINQKIAQRQPIFCDNINKIKEEDIGIYNLLKQENIKSLYLVGMYDFNDFPIGFLGVDFCTKAVTLTSEQKDQIVDKSLKLSGSFYIK